MDFEQKKVAVLEHLVLNGEHIRTQLRPLVAVWVGDRHLYSGAEDLFDGAFQKWLVDQLARDLMPGFNLSYEDVHAILDFSTLKALWKLDSWGYDV